MARKRDGLQPAMVASFAVHATTIALVFGIVWPAHRSQIGEAVAAAGPVPPMVWLVDWRPIGGGGGGGDRSPRPPTLVATPGGDERTVPAARPKTLDAVSETPRETPLIA